ncbi:putative vesicle-associated membrane protein, putative,syntaxin-like protein [Trypanosoma theileri]|uniref:Putative vesicle-associated membrane protein, putative,syntaxin-like protein n=1 Tax=Trypanosoma theileri TaxID=67003 RepID=A0A1X0P0Y0_9TRYP|nr:putative vesicle-associated membrane protein, putative,syntaxin-like protein [Trypanosoma theileri]ORC90594.1 putative vesicle-associated membrane protein, putative,syntaxin-like protein [Trypanosoma theileri]
MSQAPHLFTRDKLEEFLSLRRAAQYQAEWLGESKQQRDVNNTNTTITTTSNGVGDINRQSTPPWIRALNHFIELESRIHLKMERLHEQQRTFLQPKFLSDEEEAAQQQQIEENAQDIQKLLRELERMILSGMRPQDPNNEDERMASENAKKHLSARLSEIIQTFRGGQELYAAQRKRCEEKSRRYQQIGSHEIHEQLQKEEKIAQYLELGYAQADIEELLAEEAKQQEVSREIQDILKSITELHEMFKELGTMVVEQGSVLDRIDYNVQQTHTSVKKSVDVLKKAKESQNSCRLM